MATERRLIDANAFLEHWNKEYRHRFPCEMYKIAIANFPTVDAVEVPPVKIGDTAFFVINGKIYEAVICFITWSQFRRTGVTDELRGEVQKNHTVSARFSDWGKTVFATKEEAERVLYPCEYCFCGTYRSCEGCSYGERRTE